MKKRRIVIASVLKPVDDTRMLEKMGRTLEASDGFEIFIIGAPSRHLPAAGKITLITLGIFDRISFGRLFAPFKILFLTIKLKPEVLIVNTHELLIVSCLNRIFFGTHIFYDVRENYFRNIRYSNAFPRIFRGLISVWVRAKERLTAPLFRGFFLAEKGYKKEMNFFGDRAIIIENKAISISNIERIREPGKVNLLFTGTLADSTGIFEAINLAKQLYAVSNSVQLRIVGSCFVPETLKKIDNEIAKFPFISLVGGAKLVPHIEILSAIFSADFGIICYPSSPHTENSIPTKLYEYLTYSLPILIQKHPAWVDLCAPFQACIPLEFDKIDASLLLEQMKETQFYTTIPEGTGWETEGKKLLAFIN